MISTEKPGSPEELVHFGVKGMKWGVRKPESSGTSTKKPMSTKKKVAIGVGVGVGVVGVAAAAYILKTRGKKYIRVRKLDSGESEEFKAMIRKGREAALRISEQEKRALPKLPKNVEKRREVLGVGKRVPRSLEARRKMLGPKIY